MLILPNCGLLQIGLSDRMAAFGMNQKSLKHSDLDIDVVFCYKCKYLRTVSKKCFEKDLLCSSPSGSYKFWKWLTPNFPTKKHGNGFPDRWMFLLVRSSLKSKLRVLMLFENRIILGHDESCYSKAWINWRPEKMGPDLLQPVSMVLLAELVAKIQDAVQLQSSGSTSLYYELTGLRPINLLKPDIHIVGEPVERLPKTLRANLRFRQSLTVMIRVSNRVAQPCKRCGGLQCR